MPDHDNHRANWRDLAEAKIDEIWLLTDEIADREMKIMRLRQEIARLQQESSGAQ